MPVDNEEIKKQIIEAIDRYCQGEIDYEACTKEVNDLILTMVTVAPPE